MGKLIFSGLGVKPSSFGCTGLVSDLGITDNLPLGSSMANYTRISPAMINKKLYSFFLSLLIYICQCNIN